MSFFDDAVSTAKTVGKTVSKRTEEIIIISRKKLSAIEYENKLEKLYEDLGKIYYLIISDQSSSDEKLSEKVKESVKEIDRLKIELEKIKDEINNLSNNK